MKNDINFHWGFVGEDILCHTESEAEAMLRDYANRTRKSEDSVVKEFEV